MTCCPDHILTLTSHTTHTSQKEHNAHGRR